MEFQYPTAKLSRDYTMGIIGLFCCVPILVLVRAPAIVQLILIFGIGLSTLLLGRTWLQQHAIVHLDDDGIRMSGLAPKSVLWLHLNRFELGYFALPNKPDQGWLQLTLGAGTGKLAIDSRINGFIHILRQAVTAARNNNVKINQTTRANLHALKIYDY